VAGPCIGFRGIGFRGIGFRGIGFRARGPALVRQEGYGLELGDFEGFAASHVGAGELVVAADHVGLGFQEAGAVAFVGVAGQLGAFAADDPGNFVLAGLAALGAGDGVAALFSGLVEKFPFFHDVRLFPSRVNVIHTRPCGNGTQDHFGNGSREQGR